MAVDRYLRGERQQILPEIGGCLNEHICTIKLRADMGWLDRRYGVLMDMARWVLYADLERGVGAFGIFVHRYLS